MKLLHFVGEGRGWMTGVKEYIILSDDPDMPDNDWVAPGFELKSVSILRDDLPDSLPTNQTLVLKD